MKLLSLLINHRAENGPLPEASRVLEVRVLYRTGTGQEYHAFYGKQSFDVCVIDAAPSVKMQEEI